MISIRIGSEERTLAEATPISPPVMLWHFSSSWRSSSGPAERVLRTQPAPLPRAIARCRDLAPEMSRIARTVVQRLRLLEEENLLKYLKTLFPGDDFERTRKLGDIVHTVLHRGKPAGLILYECKKVKAFSKTHVRQTSEARRERQADYAILVTNALPGKQKFFFVQRDVIVISPAGLEPVVHTARESLIRIHLLRVSEAQKAKAVQAVYSYLAGAEYSTKVNNIAGEILDLAKELQSELQFHKRNWAKRYNIYRSVFYDVGAIDEKLRRLLGAGSSEYAEKLEAGAPKLLPYSSIPDLEPASR